MTKTEMKKATDEQVLVEYILTVSAHDTNFVLDRGTKRLHEHMKNLERELVARGVLSEHAVEVLCR